MNCAILTRDLSDFVQRFLSPFSSAPVALTQLSNVLFVSNIICHLRKEVAEANTDSPCLSNCPSFCRQQHLPLQGYPSNRIFGIFIKNLSTNFNFSYNRTKLADTLNEDLHTLTH